jgi:hypothetical protein
VLAALGALFNKVEVLDHDSPAVVLFGDGEDLGDGRPQMAVPSGCTEPGKLKGDGDRRPERVAVAVQCRHRQVPGVEVHGDDRAIAELFKGGHCSGMTAPGGVEVPAAIAWSMSDVVAYGTVGGLGCDVLAPVRPIDGTGEPVAVMGAVCQMGQCGRELGLQPAFDGVPADGLVAPRLVGFTVDGDEPTRGIPFRAPLGERLAGSTEVVTVPRQALTTPADRQGTDCQLGFDIAQTGTQDLSPALFLPAFRSAGVPDNSALCLARAEGYACGDLVDPRPQ